MRLTDDGIDWGVRPKQGDELGFGMHPYRADDCLRAAIATATQIPIEEVPDLRLDDRVDCGEDLDEISRSSWSHVEQWAESWGLAVKFWAELPVARDRWIGVSDCGRANDELEFGDHCLVMCRDRVLFNPTCSTMPPPGMELLGLGHIRDSLIYGISFEKER